MHRRRNPLAHLTLKSFVDTEALPILKLNADAYAALLDLRQKEKQSADLAVRVQRASNYYCLAVHPWKLRLREDGWAVARFTTKESTLRADGNYDAEIEYLKFGRGIPPQNIGQFAGAQVLLVHPALLRNILGFK